MSSLEPLMLEAVGYLQLEYTKINIVFVKPGLLVRQPWKQQVGAVR